MPRSRAGSGSAPPASFAAVRGGTLGSDQSTVGICSWSCSAGVSKVSRTMNCALASGPMPPRTPSTFSTTAAPHSSNGRSVPDQGSRMKLALAEARDIIARMSGSSSPRSAVSASIGQKNSCGCATWLRAKPS